MTIICLHSPEGHFKHPLTFHSTLSLHFSGLVLFRWTWVSQSYWAKGNGSGGDNGSCKTCKAPVKSSPPTNQLFTGWILPVAQPTVLKHWRESTPHSTLVWLAHFCGYQHVSCFVGSFFKRQCNVCHTGVTNGSSQKNLQGLLEQNFYSPNAFPISQTMASNNGK